MSFWSFHKKKKCQHPGQNYSAEVQIFLNALIYTVFQPMYRLVNTGLSQLHRYWHLHILYKKIQKKCGLTEHNTEKDA